MEFYRADRTSLNVERDIVRLIDVEVCRSIEETKRYVTPAHPKIYKITINVEQVEPPL